MKKSDLISKRSLEDQAAGLIRQDILDGVLLPGARLVETSLANEYELSRGTIRIALHQLGSEGLVTQVPYAGWSVAQFNDEDIWELFTLRTTLEGLAAGLAAQRITEAGVQQLQQAYRHLLAMSETGDLRIITRADLDLHKTIIELSGHRRLLQLYRLIENQCMVYISEANKTFDMHQVGSSHGELVQAICAGDAERAQAEAIGNITDVDTLQARMLSLV